MRLAHAIIQTLTYYDVMDYPMTEFEVWRHLIVSGDSRQDAWSLLDVRHLLHSHEMRLYVDESNGFYFLSGREDLVRVRQYRQRISLLKTRRLMRYVRVLRYMPFVKMIALTGRLAHRHAEDASDWDLLIVARGGHIWMCRMLVTLCTHALGVRRYGRKHTDRICLNYYMSDQALTVPTQDLYGAHEYSFIIPLFGGETFTRFVAANQWIRQYKPHYIAHEHVSTWTISDHILARCTRCVGAFVFGHRFLEERARHFQHAKIMRNPNTALPGAVIVADDHHLIFLPRPHGPEVFEEYQRRLQALEIPWPKT